MRPASGRTTPASTFISVDLPAPFSPDHGMDRAALDLEAHTVERHHAAIALGEIVDGDERPVATCSPTHALAKRGGASRAAIASQSEAYQRVDAYSDSAAMGCMPLGQSALRTLSVQGL